MTGLEEAHSVFDCCVEHSTKYAGYEWRPFLRLAPVVDAKNAVHNAVRESRKVTHRFGSGAAERIESNRPLVVERINSHFGYGAVARLKLVHAPLTRRAKRTKAKTTTPLDGEQQQQLEALLRGVEDDDIRAALSRLGQAIMTQDNR